MYNIEQALSKAGHNVQCIGVLGSDHYGSAKGFLPYPGGANLSTILKDPTFMEDWAIGQWVMERETVFHALFEQVEKKPDAILVGHPWLFAAAHKYAKSFDQHYPILIYDAHNVENKLKYDIVKYHFGDQRASDSQQRVLENEIFSIQNSDMVSCVSDEEKLWISEYRDSNILTAKNGVGNRPINLSAINDSNAISTFRKFSLYCASAHPPNIDGFFEMFKDGVGCFSPEQRLIVAGGAGFHIKQDPHFFFAPGLSKIYLDAGEVSEECLAGLLYTAHAIILPIMHGGGTNLKSAEAIWAGKHIVATPTAMRGLEQFMSAPGVKLAETADEFRNALKNVMGQHRLKLDEKEKERRKSVLWDNTLSNFVKAINQLRKVSTL
jgi:hypothetical protein